MAVSINFVITNGGDGANGVHWVLDEEVLDRMEQLAEDGEETYASGDGLQVHTLVFEDGFDLDSWIKLNSIRLTTMEDMSKYYD
jgi:hypothetical protein